MSAKYVLALLFTLMTTGACADTGPLQIGCSKLLNHDVDKLVSGEPVNLCNDYSGKVVLVVNTASKCAFTPQYEALERLYEKYKDRGLVVLGFPSNDFGHQEPGSEQQIREFCRKGRCRKSSCRSSPRASPPLPPCWRSANGMDA